MDTKICSKCDEEKVVGEFHFKNKAKGTRQSICKQCQKVVSREYYLKDREGHIARVWRRKRKLAEWLRDYKKSQRCERCGESNPACLVFHHLDPAEKGIEVSLAVRQGYGMDRLIEEINKCVILCLNCHAKEHWSDLGV